MTNIGRGATAVRYYEAWFRSEVNRIWSNCAAADGNALQKLEEANSALLSLVAEEVKWQVNILG